MHIVGNGGFVGDQWLSHTRPANNVQLHLETNDSDISDEPRTAFVPAEAIPGAGADGAGRAKGFDEVANST